VSTTEELLERKSSGSGLENREYAALTTRHQLYPQKLVLTSPTNGGRSVGIIRSRTKAPGVIVMSLVEVGTNKAPRTAILTDN
jgi:hypothetical protein